MKTKVLFTVLLSIVTMFGVSAQKFSPAPNFLKGEKQINVVFDYSQVKYDGDSQDKYYKKKDQAWIDEWEGTRRENNASAFIKSLNEELTKVDVLTGAYPEAQYTIIVDVLDCKFGSFSAGMLPARPAKLKCTARIVKTGTTETLSSIALEGSQNKYSTIGTAVDFDRMYLAFDNAGETLGKQINKVLK